MASNITISVGNLTSSQTSQHDAAVTNVLLNFAASIGAQPEWTNQQKLDHIVEYLTDYMSGVAREKWFQEQSVALRQEADEQVHW